MSNLNVEKEVNTSKSNKKKGIILIVAGLLLLVIALFLLWFFNRKFEVTFDYNNGSKEDIISVKYNNTIDKEDVKTKEDLGEQFIDWYLVIDKKDGKDVLSDKPFDFNTKIDKDIKLKAVHESKVETVTITFDSKGGSKVEAITINKGAELTLPKNPTYSGYTFKGWIDKNNRPISNKQIFNESTTLYAKWEKVAAPVKQEETISLSITNGYININGTKTSKAIATVKNASGKVTYSISSKGCATIDPNTGVVTAATVTSRDLRSLCYSTGETVTVTASLPSGKKASKTLVVERNLVLSVGNQDFIAASGNKQFSTSNNSFTVLSNQSVKWKATGVYENESTYNATKYVGKANPSTSSQAFITATTNGGQKVEIFCNTIVN